MTLPDFIIHARALAGPGRGRALSEPELLAALRQPDPAWVHLDGTRPEAAEWIARHLDYLDPDAIQALVEEDTRPRADTLGEGLILILRGVNLNAGENPENMVSVRMWIDAQRIVTVSRKRAVAIERMEAALASGDGPSEAGVFLARLVQDLTRNIGQFQKTLDQTADALEAAVSAREVAPLRARISALRLQVVAARRFLGPQSEALADMLTDPPPFLQPPQQRNIYEDHIRTRRIVEDLDELRDQTAILREEVAGQISDRLNRNMFLMAVLSAVFLPLGFLAGLFGVNLGGLPGLHGPLAFWWLCLGLAALLVLQLGLLWRLRWIGRGG